MKRVIDVLWPIVGLGAVAFTSWLLFKELRGLSLAQVEDAVGAISPLRWALAAASTAAAYCALAWYDQIALAHLGRRLSWRFVGLVSFTTYALAHNVGASVLSGAVVRYRAYSTKGLGVGEVGLLVAFCSFTFTLGNVLLGGLTLLIAPISSSATFRARRCGRDARSASSCSPGRGSTPSARCCISSR